MSTIAALQDAVMKGDADAVRRVLAERPGLAREYTDDGWSMLHLAPTPEVATALLDSGADIEAPNRHAVFGPGNRPLHGATYLNRPAVVRLLIERGADVNATDNGGWTPLHLAAANGYVEIARMLLESGAHSSTRTGAGPKQWANRTPLGLLSAENRTGEDGRPVSKETDDEMAMLLRQHGASE